MPHRVFWTHAWLARERSALGAATGIALGLLGLLLSHSATSLLWPVRKLPEETQSAGGVTDALRYSSYRQPENALSLPRLAAARQSQ